MIFIKTLLGIRTTVLVFVTDSRLDVHNSVSSQLFMIDLDLKGLADVNSAYSLSCRSVSAGWDLF